MDKLERLGFESLGATQTAARTPQRRTVYGSKRPWYEDGRTAKPASSNSATCCGPLKTARGGSDVYRLMREVQPDDWVLHLTDNRAFTAISRAATPVEDMPEPSSGESMVSCSVSNNLAARCRTDRSPSRSGCVLGAHHSASA